MLLTRVTILVESGKWLAQLYDEVGIALLLIAVSMHHARDRRHGPPPLPIGGSIYYIDPCREKGVRTVHTLAGPSKWASFRSLVMEAVSATDSEILLRLAQTRPRT